MSMSDYSEEKTLKAWFGGVAFTPPTTLYISLHTGDPGETAVPGNEVPYVDTGYTRIVSTFAFSVHTDGRWKAANVGAVTFPKALLDWGLITHFGVFDDVIGGNPIAYGVLADPAGGWVTPTPQFIAQNDIGTFAASSLALLME